METRANHILIGLFTLLVVGLIFGFIYWIERGGQPANQARVDVVFQGSVLGLTRGSQVLFNGIRIGEVSTLRFNPDKPNEVIARTLIDASAPIRTDTRVRLGFQGLTGLASIEFSGGSVEAPPLIPGPQKEGEVATINGEGSPVQALLEAAQGVAGKVDAAVGRLDRILADNEQAVSETVANVKTFSDALAANSPGIDRFLASASDLAETMSGVSERLDPLVERVDNLVAAIDPDRVRTVVANVQAFSERLASMGTGVDEVVAKASRIADRLDTFSAGLVETRDAAQRLVAAIDPDKVQQVVDSFAAFADGLPGIEENASAAVADARTAVANFRDFSEQVKSHGDDVDRIVANVDSLTEQLARTGAGVDQVVSKANSVADRLDTFSAGLVESRDSLQKLIAAVDPEKVRGTVDSVAAFADGLPGIEENASAAVADARAAIANFRDFADRVKTHGDDVDRIVAEARQIAERLSNASQRIDGVVSRLDTMLSSPDGQSMFANVSEAAQSIRQLATTLDTRLDQISADVSRFTGPGLRQVEALIDQGRRTLQRVDRVFADLERNPSGLLFGGGGSGIPEYRGSRR